MKTTLLAILSLFAISAKAQTSAYHPMPTSGAQWNFSFGGCEASPWINNGSYSIIMQGDTSIGGNTYHKL